MTKKKIWIAILIVGFLFLVGVGIVAGTMIAEYHATGRGDGKEITVVVEPGETVWDIAEKLKDKGLITYKSMFYLKVKNMQVGGLLRYGTFVFNEGVSMETIIKFLVHGGAIRESVMFTVPEGYTIEMIGAKLEKEKICTKAEFLAAAQQDYDYWFMSAIPAGISVQYRLQGFLYPDTYAISGEMTARDIVDKMLSEFDKKFTMEMIDKAQKLGKSVFDVVIEASIIERETKIDSERVTVAGVIKNRLEKKMLLEMCPTVLYPITNGMYDKTTVTNKDTQVDSPYNTYKNKGLPVGPIANPGIKSLEAALNPQEHEYLYYHTDTKKNDGSHIFTKTYKEHLETQ